MNRTPRRAFVIWSNLGVATLSSSSLPAAAIFDMDGVLIDSNPYHVQKWADFLKSRKIPFEEKTLPQQILGQRNDHAFRFFFGPEIAAEEMRRLEDELEESFREAFRPHARPSPGLEIFIRELHAAGVPMALASSAMRQNIEFVVDALGFRPFFRSILSGEDVELPKPHPEIYLKSAEKLGMAPTDCVAFEDSFVGIEAVKAAGMKCVAIASTFPFEDLRRQTRADWVVRGFEEVAVEKIRSLFASRPVAQTS
ncbi:MAG TPA: HAD family phosphatase [Terriglobia bacterium]|nr:HAD family phosphatase [Terriglobia bacterium]